MKNKTDPFTDHSLTWSSVGKHSLVYISLFVLFVLSIIPIQIAQLNEIKPPFVIMAVFYWSVFRPHLIPPTALFILGIVIDSITAHPLGITALIFLVVQWVLRTQGRFLYRQSFFIIWFSFIILSFCASSLHWSIFSLFQFTLMPLKPVILSTILGALSFPFVILILRAIHRIL